MICFYFIDFCVEMSYNYYGIKLNDIMTFNIFLFYVSFVFYENQTGLFFCKTK